MGDRLLFGPGTERTCDLPVRLPNPSPAPDKNRAPTGPEILSSTGAGLVGERPLRYLQTPVLDWINVSLRVNWKPANAGAKHIVRFGGRGERTIECALQKQFWRAQKVGLVWSAPVPSEENDRA